MDNIQFSKDDDRASVNDQWTSIAQISNIDGLERTWIVANKWKNDQRSSLNKRWIIKVGEISQQTSKSSQELDFGGKHFVFDFSGGK